jgi:hypothetical protein
LYFIIKLLLKAFKAVLPVSISEKDFIAGMQKTIMIKRAMIILGTLGALFAVGLIYCYFNYQFWTYYRTDNFTTLTEYKGEHVAGLFGRQILVNKAFVPYLARIDMYAKQHNMLILINQGYRYEGHGVSRSVVTPAKLSNHLAGFAIDFNIELNGKKIFCFKPQKKQSSKPACKHPEFYRAHPQRQGPSLGR